MELTDFPYMKQEKYIYKKCYIAHLQFFTVLFNNTFIYKIILILFKYPFREMFQC